MPKNRVIYQSEALYSSHSVKSRHTGVHAQLCRVQSANYNFNIARQDVNQFGQLARIDSIVLEPPTVGLDFTYYPTDGFNERILNFAVQTGVGTLPANGDLDMTTGVSTQLNFASGHMETSSGRNFYIVTADEGQDAVGMNVKSNRNQVIGIGNAFVSDYTLDVAVGSLPTVSVTLEGTNMIADSVVSGAGPNDASPPISGVSMAGINPVDGTSLGGTIDLPKPSQNPGGSLSAIRPGDVTVDISSMNQDFSLVNVDGSNDSIHVQSASLSLPLSRTPLQRLGSRFAFARVVDFPITATLTVNGTVNELQSGHLDQMIDRVESKTVKLTMKDTNSVPQLVYTLKGCKIESQSFSSSIGADKTVDITFTTQIGGPNDTNNGIFVSGATRSPIFKEGADKAGQTYGGFHVGSQFSGGPGIGD